MKTSKLIPSNNFPLFSIRGGFGLLFPAIGTFFQILIDNLPLKFD